MSQPSRPTAVATATPTQIDAFTPRPMGRVEKGMMILRNVGVPLPQAENSSVSAAALLKDLAVFGEADVVAVVRTLQSLQVFNEVVRTQLDHASVGERYVRIAKDFTSIREDSKRMLQQVEDGKLTLADRVQNSWMQIRRGSINSRFNRIRTNVIDVHRASEDILARLRAILEGYVEARGGLQEARLVADTLRSKAKTAWDEAKQALVAANADLKAKQEAGADARAITMAEIARDEALQATKQGERRWQIAEDLFNNLSTAYNTGDVIMGRISQAAEVQERVWQQSVSFFGTNENVLTALSASFTQLRSLHEITQGHKALKDGVKESIEDLASAGTTVMEAGLREGYGPTITAESVKKLIDSIVSFQERSFAIKDEMRALASANEAELTRVTSEGRERIAKLLSGEAGPSA